ncbi:hypothetical protein [Cellulomonas humilata]|uniref:Uncharacterized protein n=1 Tax=Cellulomonas humilata TaxID=144055 RepID=A0ABU0EA00_9CELL|nr:hypothetical protein [Cellulomonas humilata]MDQ0372058.1 hypothetical protein [Cellulomonas humilata]
MHSAIGFSGDADDVAQRRFWFGPPDSGAPSAIGVSGVIGRSTDVAILLVGLARYTAGLQIELAIRCRIDPDLGDRMLSSVGGLFAGVEFADGRAVAVGGRYSRNNRSTADQSVLTHWGGGGGREWSSTLWLTPAPPPGDPVLVVADPALAWTSRVAPWMPKRCERRSRRLRSCGRASQIRRTRPFSRHRSTYRPGAGSNGYFRR